MIAQVAFAASQDEARPILQGVLISVEDQQITLAATDGFRVSVRHALLSNPRQVPVNLIVPARALTELSRVAADGNQTVTVIIPPSRGQVIFHLKDVEVVSQLIDGSFPDFRAIIPKSFKTRTVVATSAILKACRQAEIIAREGNNVIRLNIVPGTDGPGTVEISAQTEETGSSDIKVDANIEGNALVIAFNVRFLREVLDVIKSPNVALETNANNAPGKLQPVGDDSFTHIIMPMHIG